MKSVAMQSIVDWVADRDHTGGMYFYTGQSWECLTYESAAAQVLGVAQHLRDRGVGAGDRIALLLPTCPEFVKFFFGTLAVGAIPTVVAPPGLQFGGHSGHISQLRVLEPTVIVAESATLAALRDGGAPLAPQLIDVADPVPPATDTRMNPPIGDETAIIQFTSGSTSLPRAVRISSRAVIEHIEMFRSAFDQDELRKGSHVFGSWLPLYHDMGLIGMFLSPISSSLDTWLMRPEHFVRRPATWLELFGRRGVHHSAMPNFAVERMVRVVSDNTLEGMDFSGWRTLIVGSDRINFAALHAFYDLLAPHGFRPDTIKPGYGMAETTLAVSTIGPDEMPSALAVNCRSLTDEAKIEVVDRLALTDDDVVNEGTHLVVSCGRELPGARISVVGADRSEVPDGQVGELVVESPALFSGYLDEDGTDPPAPPSAHHTGDLGFRYDGEVYILGRMGNSVKVNGTFVTAEDIELMMSERVGIHHDKVTVVLRDTEKTGKVSTLVVFQQRIPREGVDSALRVLGRMGLAVEASALVIMRPLAIPRTTSGKPRRIELWTDLESGLATFKELYVGAVSPFFGVMLGESDDSACR